MDARVQTLKRTLSAPLAALMLTLSVAVPVMERSDLTHERAVESEHHSSCPTPHDHTIHRLVGATQGARASAPTHRDRTALLELAQPPAPVGWLSAETTRRASARAPPEA